MNSEFITNLANDVIRQNHHWKEEYQKLKLKFQDYQNLIFKSFQITQLKEILQIDSYQCIKIMTQRLISTYYQLNEFKIQNIKLKEQILSKEKIISQIAFNRQVYQNIIIQKQHELIKYVQQSQLKIKLGLDLIYEITQQKNKYQIQYSECYAKLSTIQNQLTQQFTKKTNQLIRTQKRQFIQFRRNIQQESIKIQQLLRVQSRSKTLEVNNLIYIVNEFLNPNKIQINNPNLTVLQQLIKPYQNYHQLTNKIQSLRTQLSQKTNDIRKGINNRLQLEAIISELKFDCQQWKHKYNQTQTNLKSLNEQFKVLKADLIKITDQKQQMNKYYEQRWLKDFNRVNANLEKKISIRQANLEKEYQQKKIQVQNNISNNQKFFQQQKQELQQFIQKYNQIARQNNKLQNQNKQLKICLRQSEKMYIQQIILRRQSQINKIQQLNRQIVRFNNLIQFQKQNNSVKINQMLQQINLVKLESSKQHDLLILNYEAKINMIKQQSQQNKKTIFLLREQCENLQVIIKKQIEQIKDKQKEFSQLSTIKAKNKKNSEQFSIIKQKLQGINKKSQSKIKQLNYEIENIKLKNILTQQKNQMKINEAMKQIESYGQKYNAIQIKLNAYQKQKRDETIKISNLQFEIKSLKVMLQSKSQKVQSLNNELNDMFYQKKQVQERNKLNLKMMKQEFNELHKKCESKINFYRNRIRELQNILAKTPIDFQQEQKIKILTIQNQRLEKNIYAKESQNIILQQTKSYYEAKLKENEAKLNFEYLVRNTKKSILIRKPYKIREIITAQNQISQTQQNIFDPQEITQLKRQIKNKSNQKASKSAYRERNKSSMI